MYYKGDILTLWVYLSEILQRYDEDAILPSTMASTPHLVHLLLRQIDCAILIKWGCPGKLSDGISIEKLLHNLTLIIDNPLIDPESRSRALAMRVMKQCNWFAGRVNDLDGKPASEELKERSLRETREAIRLHEDFKTTNKGMLYLTLHIVERGLGMPTEGSWANACSQLSLLDRDDLRVSLSFIIFRTPAAVNAKDNKTVKACVLAIQEALALGEWGKMFDTQWFKKTEPNLLTHEVWRTEWDAAIRGTDSHFYGIQKRSSMGGEHKVARKLATAAGTGAVEAVAKFAVNTALKDVTGQQ
jgi:hypothetical protein